MSLDEQARRIRQNRQKQVGLTAGGAIVGRDDGLIFTQMGNVYVRQQSSNGLAVAGIVEPPMSVIPLQMNTPILIDYNPKRKRLFISGLNNQGISAAGNSYAPTVAQMLPSSTTQTQIDTFRTVPSNPASLVLTIKSWQPKVLGVYHLFPGGIVDLGPSGFNVVPSAGMMRYAVISVLSDYITMDVQVSTPRPVTDIPLGEADLNEASALDAVGAIDAFCVKLIGGQTQIKQSDLDADGIDLRQFLNV